MGAFDLILTPEKSNWSGIIKSDLASGTIKIPNNVTGAEKINLSLTALDLSALKSVESTANNEAVKEVEPRKGLLPTELPLFSINSDDPRNFKIWCNHNWRAFAEV